MPTSNRPGEVAVPVSSSMLTHHALEAMLLGCFEELLAVIEGVYQVQAGHLGPSEQALQPSSAPGQRYGSEIATIVVQQVEGVHRELVLPITTHGRVQPIEVRGAVRPWET